jgi:hypothetical protein
MAHAAEGAGEGDASPWDKPLSASVVLGLGAPAGYAGAAFDVTPVRYFTLGVGLGVTGDGPQEEAHARLRLPLGRSAIVLGGGPSTGPYNDNGAFLCGLYGGDCTTRSWARAWWLNGDIAFEHRTPGGLEVRVFLGWAKQIDTPATSCVVHHGDHEARRVAEYEPCGVSANADDRSPFSFPYVGLALGYAFGD